MTVPLVCRKADFKAWSAACARGYSWGSSPVLGGTFPALIWHDFMQAALAHTHWATFPNPSFSGYTVQPQRVVALPPSPSPSPSPSKSPNCRKPPCKPGH